MKVKAVYPGTFDPVTYGHIDVIRRAGKLFDTVYVAVASNQQKNPLFTSQERVSYIKRATRSLKNVHVDAFDSLVVRYAQKKGAKVMIRGMRATSDFDYEFQMALMNRKLSDAVQTIFLMPSERHFYLSSTLIKEIARLGGSLQNVVPTYVEKALKARL